MHMGPGGVLHLRSTSRWFKRLLDDLGLKICVAARATLGVPPPPPEIPETRWATLIFVFDREVRRGSLAPLPRVLIISTRFVAK